MDEPAQIVKSVIGTNSWTYRCSEDGHRHPTAPFFDSEHEAEEAAARHLDDWHGDGNGRPTAPPGAELNPGWRVVEG